MCSLWRNTARRNNFKNNSAIGSAHSVAMNDRFFISPHLQQIAVARFSSYQLVRYSVAGSAHRSARSTGGKHKHKTHLISPLHKSIDADVFIQTGYMFGKGVYFADMSSKSANYCFTTRSKPTGLVVLADVSVLTHSLIDRLIRLGGAREYSRLARRRLQSRQAIYQVQQHTGNRTDRS